MDKIKRYENLDGIKSWKQFRDFIQWRKERFSKKKDLTYRVPREENPEIDYLHVNRPEVTITWIGHSTFLIQCGGLNIITDPVRASYMANERRLTAPGILLKDLPAIDIVLISHSHYDHLHIPSIRGLKGNPILFVPEGLKSFMNLKGFTRVEEYVWWSGQLHNEIEFTFVPAQHWTRRTLWDMNASHWGGWVIKCQDLSIYFAGDSAYFRGFKQIGEKFPWIDYAILPIGCYEPEWFMSLQHTTPEEAVQAYIDLGARYFIPMHFSSFRLADDTPKEALDRLHTTWVNNGLEPSSLLVGKHGETFRCSEQKKYQ